MRPATAAVQRPPDARLLVVRADGELAEAARPTLARHLRPGDLVVANDAATLPASLRGVHGPTGAPIEIRLAGRGSLRVDDVYAFMAVAFGAGDHRQRTEDRPSPPELAAGDALRLGPLVATVTRVLGHPRLIDLRFEGAPERVWAGIAQHGRPIQYAHVRDELSLWDTWTPVAALAVAFEPPSASFLVDWAFLASLDERGVGFAALTHAAGISSTGDPELDATLPFDEAYFLPRSTVDAIGRTRASGGRVVALGTTVTRALEHAGDQPGGLRSGHALATQRIGRYSRIRVVDAIVSGVHGPGESHYELLRAFASDDVLARVGVALEARGYRTHEFGDSVLLEHHRGPATVPVS